MLEKPQMNKSQNFNNIEKSQNPFQDEEFLKKRRQSVIDEISKESKIEKFYSNRVKTKLIQSGYKIFADNGLSNSSKSSIIGSAQDNYLLGPGDQIILNLQGQLMIRSILMSIEKVYCF